MNPNATIPMLTHGHTKVIGDGESIYNYMVNSCEEVSNHFFHEAQSRKINEIMSYFMRTIRRVTGKLIQAVANPKVFGQKRRTDDKRIKQYLSEFFDLILTKLDAYLIKGGYITGPKITIVDIMIVCEIETICRMYKRELPQNLTKLADWHGRLIEERALKKVNV